MSDTANIPQDHLSITVDDGVVTITLDSPPANALSVSMMQELRAAVASETVRDARVVIVRSALPRFFAAGADLKLLATLNRHAFADYLADLRQVFDDVTAITAPTVAAVEGLALGGGLELALACDLRVASTGALLGVPEVKLGLVPGAGGTQRLPRLIGTARAFDLLVTGRAVSAAEALEMGLVNRVAERADDGAAELAREIARHPGSAAKVIGRCLDAARETDPSAGMRVELDEVVDLFASEPARTAIRDFIERPRGAATPG